MNSTIRARLRKCTRVSGANRNYGIVVLLGVILLDGSMHAQEATKVLDLTGFVPPEGAPSAWGSGSPIVASQGGRVTMSRPLRLSLVDVIPRTGQPGEALTYEARLRNIGAHAVTIPWNPDWKSVQDKREVPPPGYRAAWLSLFVEVNGQKRRLAEHFLFGSEKKAGSLLKLAPGDAVRFRAPGTWPSVSSETDFGSIELPLQVHFIFLYGPAEPNTEGRYISEPRVFALKLPR